MSEMAIFRQSRGLPVAGANLTPTLLVWSRVSLDAHVVGTEDVILIDHDCRSTVPNGREKLLYGQGSFHLENDPLIRTRLRTVLGQVWINSEDRVPRLNPDVPNSGLKFDRLNQ